MRALQAWCEKTAQNSFFQYLILVVIIFNAALVGFETSEELESDYGTVFNFLEQSVQVIFIVEILIRLIAYHPNYGRFFTSGWNVFDITVVLLTFLPQVGTLSTIVRVARILRITRVVQFSKELRLIVDTMFRSLPSMFHVTLLLGMLIYVYGVMGVHLFRKGGDQTRWGNLGAGVWSMFQIITIENWPTVSDTVTAQHPWAWIFFFSFILLGVFVGLNLFVATVMNNLEEVKEENEQAQLAGEDANAIMKRVADLEKQLEDLEMALQGTTNGKPKE